jgi:hypothetical protein
MLCFKIPHVSPMGLRPGEDEGHWVTMSQIDTLVRPTNFLSHEPGPDPLYTIPILLPLVLPFNPHSPVSR